ncbi:MAG: hypothetical protein K6G04_05515 [Lachnospiraceae bacterium]|nr:hypothetical protein [Lachnospiraceae bacterium]
MLSFTKITDSKRDMKSLISKFTSNQGLATTMVVLAVICSIYFCVTMVNHAKSDTTGMVYSVHDAYAVGASMIDDEITAVVRQDSQVIREIDLGQLFDTEQGVTVRNLDTEDMARITEPGVTMAGADGDAYSYIIEERRDGGQDLMVSMRINQQDNYLVSYQLIDTESGDKYLANITVVNGTVTAESVYNSQEFSAKIH